MCDGWPDCLPEALRSDDATKCSAAYAIQLKSLHLSGKQEDKSKSVKSLLFKNQSHPGHSCISVLLSEKRAL